MPPKRARKTNQNNTKKAKQPAPLWKNKLGLATLILTPTGLFIGQALDIQKFFSADLENTRITDSPNPQPNQSLPSMRHIESTANVVFHGTTPHPRSLSRTPIDHRYYAPPILAWAIEGVEKLDLSHVDVSFGRKTVDHNIAWDFSVQKNWLKPVYSQAEQQLNLEFDTSTAIYSMDKEAPYGLYRLKYKLFDNKKLSGKTAYEFNYAYLTNFASSSGGWHSETDHIVPTGAHGNSLLIDVPAGRNATTLGAIKQRFDFRGPFEVAGRYRIKSYNGSFNRVYPGLRFTLRNVKHGYMAAAVLADGSVEAFKVESQSASTPNRNKIAGFYRNSPIIGTDVYFLLRFTRDLDQGFLKLYVGLTAPIPKRNQPVAVIEFDQTFLDTGFDIIWIELLHFGKMELHNLTVSEITR
jgi:hypothetical protein